MSTTELYQIRIPRPNGNFENGYEVAYQCPYCPCQWSTLSDLQGHLDAFGHNQQIHTQKIAALQKYHSSTEDGKFTWFKSKYDTTEELMLAAEDPETTLKLQRIGTIVTSRYSLKLKGKWIIKKTTGA